MVQKLKNTNNYLFGFTLAETLIALVILGVVAAITIPSLIRQYLEATNRTKVKKAMAAYEKAIGQMVVENGNSAISSWADGIVKNCANTTIFFKKVQGEGCRFKTSDGVWWNITNIEHPIIAFNETDLDDTTAINRFELFAHNEDGILRVNDKADKLLSEADKKALEKLYDFINNVKNASCDVVTSCNDSYCTFKDCNDNTVAEAYSCPEGTDISTINSCKEAYTYVDDKKISCVEGFCYYDSSDGYINYASGYGCKDVTDMNSCDNLTIYKNNNTLVGDGCSDVEDIKSCDVVTTLLDNGGQIVCERSVGTCSYTHYGEDLRVAYGCQDMTDPSLCQGIYDFWLVDQKALGVNCTNLLNSESCNQCYDMSGGNACSTVEYTECVNNGEYTDCCKAGYHYDNEVQHHCVQNAQQ